MALQGAATALKAPNRTARHNAPGARIKEKNQVPEPDATAIRALFFFYISLHPGLPPWAVLSRPFRAFPRR